MDKIYNDNSFDDKEDTLSTSDSFFADDRILYQYWNREESKSKARGYVTREKYVLLLNEEKHELKRKDVIQDHKSYIKIT